MHSVIRGSIREVLLLLLLLTKRMLLDRSTFFSLPLLPLSYVTPILASFVLDVIDVDEVRRSDRRGKADHSKRKRRTRVMMTRRLMKMVS